ncbi:hypothetical protein MTO96_051910 [Rhipicephalus appendiculatus]
MKDFRNKHKSILWEKIAEILKEVDQSVTADELQARWKNLKDTFRKKLREEKKIKKSGAAAPSKTAYWPHTEQMTFLRDVMEPRRSISNMDACEETAVSTSFRVEPLDLPSQACRNGSEVDNCPTTRNPFELIFQGPSVPERVTTPSNPPPHHPPPSNPPPSNPSQAASCPRESEEVSSTPQPRSKRQRKKELETVDDELNAVRNVIVAHKPMDANGLFLVSLKSYLQSTPQETDLKMDLRLMEAAGCVQPRPTVGRSLPNSLHQKKCRLFTHYKEQQAALVSSVAGVEVDLAGDACCESPGRLEKKLVTASKTSCAVIRLWIRSIVKHLYFAAAVESPAFRKLAAIVDKPRLLNDLRKLSPAVQTFSLESFNSVLIQFAPKSTAYSPSGMKARAPPTSPAAGEATVAHEDQRDHQPPQKKKREVLFEQLGNVQKELTSCASKDIDENFAATLVEHMGTV